MVLASSIKIEVHQPAGTPIGEIMNEVRSWLDRNRIEPIDFKTVVGREGIGFEISGSRPLVSRGYRPKRRFRC